MAFIVPQASKAQEFVINAELICNETKHIVNVLRKEYKEMPFLFGKAGDEAKSIMSLWVNPTTKNWTILATKEDITCVVGVGSKFELVPYKENSKL